MLRSHGHCDGGVAGVNGRDERRSTAPLPSAIHRQEIRAAQEEFVAYERLSIYVDGIGQL